MQEEREKVVELVDAFYDKTRLRIDKSLNKENRKASLFCRELLQELSQNPKQETYEVSRLNDELFN